MGAIVAGHLGLAAAAAEEARADPVVLETAYQPLPPKYWRDDAGRMHGLGWRILRAVDDRLPNVEIPPSDFLPWPRLQGELTEGRLDVFFGMARSARRAALYDYIEPPIYAVTHVAVVRSSDLIQPTSLAAIKDLPPGTVATNYGSATERYLRDAGIELAAGAPELSRNLLLLSRGRIRMFYFHDLGIAHHLQIVGDHSFRVIQGDFRRYYHYLATRKNLPVHVLEDLTQAVAGLEADGSLAAVRARYVGFDADVVQPPVPRL